MAKFVSGLAHTALNVSDMDASVKFYEGALGFEKAFEMDNPETGKPWIVYLHVAGGQFLELFYDAVHPIPYDDANIGFSHLCFEVRDIREAAEWLEKSGYPLDIPAQFGIDGNWQCWTHDPDGNRIELMQMDEGSLHDKYLKGLE